MRKRSGSANWFTVINTDPVGNDIGSEVRARFDVLTFLSLTGDESFLNTRLRLTPDVILNKVLVAGADEWQAKSVDLVKPVGLIDKLRLDETVSLFIPLFNGSRTVGQIAAIVSEHLRVSIEEAQRRCLQLGRRLLQSNFLLLEDGYFESR